MSQNLSLREPPRRGFDQAEFETRTAKAQAAMAAEGMDALFLTTEPEFRYFSGFHSQFWESPTRPWYLVVPREGRPIGVIPEIGAAGLADTWVEDIRTWPAPVPEDDGISLLTGVLKELPRKNGRLGVPLGPETHIRMPARNFEALQAGLPGMNIVDATDLVRGLRMVKSEAEIDKIRHACLVTSDGFIALPDAVEPGDSERDICRKLRMDLLRRGADSSPYVIAGSGPGSYDNIIMGPTDRVPGRGDVLIIDTGTTFDGYFCDFDRNFAFGEVSEEARRAHAVVYAATEAGLAAARPGVTASDLCAAMWQVLEEGGALGNDVGRLGHGLGMQLTEWPSHRLGDDTVFEPGMVLTLEPGMTFAPGKLMVHEENIVVRDGAPELLTLRAPEEMPVI